MVKCVLLLFKIVVTLLGDERPGACTGRSQKDLLPVDKDPGPRIKSAIREESLYGSKNRRGMNIERYYLCCQTAGGRDNQRVPFRRLGGF